MTTITLEQVEALVSTMEADEAGERSKLRRLISAYARILAAKDPTVFSRRETVRADEDGHWDNSFPPDIEAKAFIGPALIEVTRLSTEDRATTSGFYHEWERSTSDPGVYVHRTGRIYGADETGTGRVGRFAARPGNCDVDCRIDWYAREIDDVSTKELRTAEEMLRKMALPLVAAAASGE